VEPIKLIKLRKKGNQFT